MVGMKLASRPRRLLGQFIDGIVGSLPVFLAFPALIVSESAGTLVLAVGVSWAILYYLFADGRNGGRSFGKEWLGMQVVDLDSGGACSYGQSFVRNLLLAILGPIDWVFIFGERRQRLGDKAAGTIVIGD